MNNSFDTKIRLNGISVAIVDDHEAVLEGVRIFMVKNGIAETECFTNARSLLDRVASRKFDVYIVDIELPDMEASDLIGSIRQLQSDAKIIIHTIHEEMWVVNKMTEMQVEGVVYKSAHLGQLLNAVVAVHDGQQYYCSKFKKLQRILSLQNDVPTDRELQVLECVGKGYSTKVIAKKLYISENTVENHRKSLFKKLHANNVASLIVKSIAAGYLNPQELSTGSEKS